MPNPPLIFLCAAAAFCAAALQQTAIPLITGASEYRASLGALGEAANFATNLAATSGIIALGFALLGFAQRATWLGLPRRFFLAALSGVFLTSMVIAVLFDRQRTTTQTVLLSLGAASLLTSLLHGIAFRLARGAVPRLLAACATLMAAAALCTQILQLWSETSLSAWHLRALSVTRTAGELAYLALMLAAACLALPLRHRLTRSMGSAVLVTSTLGLIMAERALGKDYALVLYQHQRVSLWIDTLPGIYALPLAIGLSGATMGLIGGNAQRRQGACGLVLLLASGYAPPAPGRLLTLTLGLALLARAIIGMAFEDERAQRRDATST